MDKIREQAKQGLKLQSPIVIESTRSPTRNKNLTTPTKYE